jgi:hypothetical protein
MGNVEALLLDEVEMCAEQTDHGPEEDCIGRQDGQESGRKLVFGQKKGQGAKLTWILKQAVAKGSERHSVQPGHMLRDGG